MTFNCVFYNYWYSTEYIVLVHSTECVFLVWLTLQPAGLKQIGKFKFVSMLGYTIQILIGNSLGYRMIILTGYTYTLI